MLDTALRFSRLFFKLMYNIDELSSMNEAELKDLAKTMGLKKVNNADKDNLIYQIIDQQAIDASINTPEAPKRRRGRTKKESSDTAKTVVEEKKEKKSSKSTDASSKQTNSKNIEAEVQENIDPESDDAPKRKRGRPRKSDQKSSQKEQLPGLEEPKQESVETESPQDDNVEAKPVKRAKRERIERNVVQETIDYEESENNEQVLEVQVNDMIAPVETLPTVELVDDKVNDVPEPNVEQPIDEPNEAFDDYGEEVMDQIEPSHFDPNQDDFMSLFNTNPNASIGKKSKRNDNQNNGGQFFSNGPMTFKPRTQEEKEEAARRAEEQRRIAAEEAAKAPIIIHEPKAEKEQPQNKQQKKKKGKNQQAQQPESSLPYSDVVYNFDGILNGMGVLEVMPDGYGFLRSSDYNYLTSPDDIYVQQSHIKNYGLKTGDVVECTIRPPKEGEKYFPLVDVRLINGRTPEFVRDRIPFEHLVPLFPNEKFDLVNHTHPNISTRIVDMFSPIQDYSNEEIDNLLKTNLYSYIWACRDVSKYMIGQKYGNIINISSVFGQTGASCESIYSVSKAGIDGLTKSLAKELGLSNIRVNSIAPGLIDTDMNARLDEDEKQAFIEDEIPLGRIGTPADVANVVEMLEKCDYITGQVINVSGGWDK